MANDKKKPGFGDHPGTQDMGQGQADAADKGEGDVQDAFAKHNADAADKAPDTKKPPFPPKSQKSYAAELGEALAVHANEQGRKFGPS